MTKRIHLKEYAIVVLLLALCGTLTVLAVGRPTESAAEADIVHELQPVRVAAPKQERVFSSLSPYGPGFEQEILALFADHSGLDVAWTDVQSPEEGWEAVNEGWADVCIGLGYNPPDSLNDPIAAGPAYAHYKPLLVREKSAKTCASTRNEGCDAVLLTAAPHLERQLDAEQKNTLPTDTRVRNDARMHPLLNSLHVDHDRLALVDDGQFKLWQPFYQQLRPSVALGEETPYRWYWRRADATLDATLNNFWLSEDTERRLQKLTEKYFGFLPAETDYFELRHFSRTIQKQLPKYQELIVEAARDNGLDPLFLAAVIYQESHFDAGATSKTNVRGLMQITTGTARLMGIEDRTDPAQSIQAGARYLRSLYDDLEPLGLEPWDRWFFALAAYNQGPGHLNDAVKLTRSLGGEGESWAELKKTFPLLAWEKYYSRVRHGYTRGFEAVDYVESVRYYYYILHGLVALSRPEAEHLAPLLGVIPATWPVVS